MGLYENARALDFYAPIITALFSIGSATGLMASRVKEGLMLSAEENWYDVDLSKNTVNRDARHIRLCL